jgi:hypothetical protein
MNLDPESNNLQDLNQWDKTLAEPSRFAFTDDELDVKCRSAQNSPKSRMFQGETDELENLGLNDLLPDLGDFLV